jgi:uncharacterized protein (DUF924 family)
LSRKAICRHAGRPEFAATAWVAEVLQFWFGELSAAQWFQARCVRGRAYPSALPRVHELVSATPDTELLGDARSALGGRHRARQFSRNMFRGDPRAFASDAKALAIAEAAHREGLY